MQAGTTAGVTRATSSLATDGTSAERGDGLAATDGRLARSARTRLAIVDALRSLHRDGDLLPTAPRVAERAGVSLRTVWQHFEDLETLFVEAGRRDLEIATGFVEPVDPALPLIDRVRAFVGQRARMFEEMAPVWRAARLKEPFSPQIRANHQRLVTLGRDQIESVFACELAAQRSADDRAHLRSAVEVASAWAVWESLRVEQQLEVEAATAVVVTLVLAVLK